jgi:hypothetical protein
MQVTSTNARVGTVEVMVLVGLCALFLVSNLLTATWFPIVWCDEVGLIDPAVRLCAGQGFTTSCGGELLRTDFCAVNAPLFSLMMAGWLKLFGFGIIAARSMNYVLTVTAAVAAWWATVRLRLLQAAWSRLLLVVLLFTGYGVTFIFRSVRRDSVAEWLVCLAFLAYSISNLRWRRLAMIGLGALIPAAGLETVLYVAIMVLLLQVFLDKGFLKTVLALPIVACLGYLGLIGFFFLHGVGLVFLHSTIGFSRTLAGDLAFAVAFRDTSRLVEHFTSLPNFQWLCRDRSWIFLFAICILLAARAIMQRRFVWRSVYVFGIAAGLAGPLVMIVLGRYPLYYSWMGFVPLAIAACASCEQLCPRENRGWCTVVTALLALAVAVGLPAEVLRGRDGDYEQIEKLVRRAVKPQDWVFGDAAVYYATKSVCQEYFNTAYTGSKLLPKMPADERNRVTVMILNPVDFPAAVQKVGGDWVETGDGVISGQPSAAGPHDLPRGYALRVYRRKTEIH